MLNELRADARALQHQAGDILIDAAERRADLRDGEARLQQRAALLRLGAVTRGRMHDFMAEHGG